MNKAVHLEPYCPEKGTRARLRYGTEARFISIDDHARSYLTKLGFEKGATVVADPVEGDHLAWIVRAGRVVTETELSILSSSANLESLIRAGQESEADIDTIEPEQPFVQVVGIVKTVGLPGRS